MRARPWSRDGLSALLLAVFVVIAAVVSAPPARAASTPPAETREFAPLIGTWMCRTISPQQDGTVVEGTASWRFWWILDGAAIMDEWRAIARDGSPFVGVNIRHYDAGAGHWVARWLEHRNLAWREFTGNWEDGTFTMVGDYAMGPGVEGLARFTFHDIEADRFSWRMDWSRDEGATWTEGVFRIEGTRVPDTLEAGDPARAARTAAALDLDLAGLPHELDDLGEDAPSVWQDGRVLVAGQPSAELLTQWGHDGVTTVVNLRTPEEMDDPEQMEYDEVAIAAELGLTYVHIPLGGSEYPYTPQAVDRLAEVIDGLEGGLLLHCSVGGRASYLWTAYLTRHGGLTFDAALARGQAMRIRPSPLAGFLGHPLRLEPVTE